jgi:hypothetical protein
MNAYHSVDQDKLIFYICNYILQLLYTKQCYNHYFLEGFVDLIMVNRHDHGRINYIDTEP